eukprot:scaffold99754_cov58-Attheya_sp.AAC.1
MEGGYEYRQQSFLFPSHYNHHINNSYTISNGMTAAHEAVSASRRPNIKLKCIVLGAAGAGKTSILRRFYHNNFKHERVPTVGSDFYTRKIPNPVYSSSEQDSAEETPPIWAPSITLEPTVSIQLWDTAGRERLVTSPQKGFSSALGDAFFSNADAAMLVYDATSSTSFTTLIKWYAELMERMHSLDSDDDTTDNENENSGGDAANNGGNSSVNQVSTQNGTLMEQSSSKQHKRKKKRYRFPVLIVANKLDKFKVGTAQPRQRTIVKQRDVMGLNGNFKGKDSRYEYRVEPPRIYDDDDEHSRKKKRKRKMKHRGEKWTTDFSYLEHLLKSEDGSHPDRDMVLLWCMRNGLKHAEVSALDGTGVSAAVDELVTLALETMNKHEMQLIRDRENQMYDMDYLQEQQERLSAYKPQIPSEELHSANAWRPNNPLDLQERYKPKETQRCCFGLLPWCR